jgi:hypothetical protein
MGAKRKGTASKITKAPTKAAPPTPAPAYPPGPRKCKHAKKNGKPCRAPPLKDSDFCLAHDPRPEIRAKLAKSSSAGGEAKAAKDSIQWDRIEVTDRESLRKFVDQVVDQVARGKMQPKISYALAPHLTLLVKLFEPTDADPAPPASQDAEILPAVLEVLDAHPEAKAEMIKRMEMISK